MPEVAAGVATSNLALTPNGRGNEKSRTHKPMSLRVIDQLINQADNLARLSTTEENQQWPDVSFVLCAKDPLRSADAFSG